MDNDTVCPVNLSNRAISRCRNVVATVYFGSIWALTGCVVPEGRNPLHLIPPWGSDERERYPWRVRDEYKARSMSRVCSRALESIR